MPCPMIFSWSFSTSSLGPEIVTEFDELWQATTTGPFPHHFEASSAPKPKMKEISIASTIWLRHKTEFFNFTRKEYLNTVQKNREGNLY